MASAPLPSSSSARGLKYDVFLSFRGSDARKGIATELHRLLTKRGIETYMDTNLKGGNVISPALLKPIEESRFAIVILSPNYASSTRCLQEIAKICRCMEYNDRILPLFFNVEPDDVLLLKRSFEEAFTDYENSELYKSEKLQEWKDGLKKVANCKGWNLKNYNTERELIKKIVEEMYSKVQPIENNKGDIEATREAKNTIENNKGDIEATREAKNTIENNKGDLEATREAKNTAHVVSHANVSGGKISGSNVNLGQQGDVVSSVSGDYIKGVRGNIIRAGPSGNIIGGDRGGDGGNSYYGGFAGAGGQAKGNNTFNYDKK